jgi:Arc/MetJ-type ribon-helix-helix transcriptional regulator
VHPRRERVIRTSELLEVEARHLDDHVVDGRFERGSCATRDVVRDLVERVAEGETRSDLRDREAGGLRGERR